MYLIIPIKHAITCSKETNYKSMQNNICYEISILKLAINNILLYLKLKKDAYDDDEPL